MGRLTDLNPKNPIMDADVPAAIARDTEVVAAIAAHEANANLHGIYYKILNFTAGPPSTDGSVVSVAHGISSAKILGFSVAIEVSASTGFWVGPNYFLSGNLLTQNRFLAYLSNGFLYVENYPGDCANIVNKRGRAVIWYLP